MIELIDVIECNSCYGYTTLKNRMVDQRYVLSNCPFCGSDDIELDRLELSEENIDA